MPQIFQGLSRLSAQAALLLCLCLFLFCSSSFSTNAQVPAAEKFSQQIRTFHSAEEFKRLTKDKVKIYRQPTLKYVGGELIGSSSGIVLKRRDGSISPYPSGIQLP